MADATQAQIRDGLIDCVDAAGIAQVALHPLRSKPDRPSWREFLNPFSAVPAFQQWEASQPDARVYEAAAISAGEFDGVVQELLAVFADEPLRVAAAPGPSWKDRIWKARSTVDLITIGMEIDTAADIVNDLFGQLRLGAELQPRDA